MVKYNTKEWFSLIFQFHRSDTFRILLPAIAIISIYSWGVAWFEIEYLGKATGSPVMHTLLGFVISLLLVFRTNTAYERWWEGRKLWGTLVNNSRNIAVKVNSYVTSQEDKTHFTKLLASFPYALKDHLRDKTHQTNGPAHKPLAITSEIFVLVNQWYKDKKIDHAQLMNLNTDLSSLMDICGGCERIRKTPIPYSYSIFLKKFIFVYIMTMPFGLVKDFGFWEILIVSFMFYVLASLELIAEEIEDPFGEDSNDLPTDEISDTIKKNVFEVLNVK